MVNKVVPESVFNDKRIFFDEGNTRSYAYRIEQLKRFKKAIQQSEKDILDALHNDLNKPNFEAFTSEVGFLYEDINHVIKNLRKWMRPKKVSTPIVLEASKSKVVSEPLGVVLIIGPWNYPFQLLLSPLVGAIAAGNCAVIKPSEETPKTALLIEEIIKNTFDEKYISVVQGDGHIIGSALIQQFPFNHIFFTGSLAVGKRIAEMAAVHLSPVTLELGGKSPAIVDKNVNIDKAAKRITFGKFFNAGQTCVSPDYVMVHADVKQQLVDRVKFYISSFYGDDPLQSEHLARIINTKRFTVLKSYLKQGEVVKGGRYDESRHVIEPTILENIKSDQAVLHEEIFGPILPIVEWRDEKEIVEYVRKNRYPLACYVFTKNKGFEDFIINSIEFGGGSVNNTLVHLINPNLPFGGVGPSGVGRYHGKYSFETFSHKKSILKSSTLIDLPLRYAPYTAKKMKRVKLFFK